MSTFGGYVWQRLSDRTRELLQPLLVSLYSKTDRMITYSVPLILSEHGQNYHDWLSNWGRQLMQMIKDPKVCFLSCLDGSFFLLQFIYLSDHSVNSPFTI
jgi:hypothetical protein